MCPRRGNILCLYKLFGNNHVADIVGTSASTSTIAAAATWVMTRNEMLVALKDTCKYLEERKALFERMILTLENEEADAGDNVYAGMAEEGVNEEEEEAGDDVEDMDADD
jgi:hypothetical protein